MYLRITQRHNRDGSSVTYYALAESVWNPDAKRREAHVVHSFGRADQLDRAELERLVKSINRVLDGGNGNDAADKIETSGRNAETRNHLYAIENVRLSRCRRRTHFWTPRRPAEGHSSGWSVNGTQQRQTTVIIRIVFGRCPCDQFLP
jgi:hypothetical protein